jgi:tRNA(Glu) U13 pseudouridine synthase TruD
VRPPNSGRAEDFLVDEVLLESPGRTGDYAIYQATKRWLTTPQLQQRLAQRLRFFLPPGSYGTLVLKALTSGTGEAQAWRQGLEQDIPGDHPED